MNIVLMRIKERISEMTKKEVVVANAILKDPGAFVSKSVTEYAEYIASTPATITRCCKRLGVAKVSDLRIALAKSIPQESSGLEFVSYGSSHPAEEIFESTMGSFKALYAILDQNSMEEAASLISGARHVLLCGIGASGLVAMDFQQKMVRLGILAYYGNDLDVQKIRISFFDQRDVVIAFSYSGSKPGVCDIVKLAHGRNVKVISMTKAGSNPVSDLADVALHVAPTESIVREGATVSRLQMLFLVDVLFRMLIEKSSRSADSLINTWNTVSGE